MANIRRVVTGHDAAGNAVIATEDTVKMEKVPHDPFCPKGALFGVIWGSEAVPVDNLEEGDAAARVLTPGQTNGCVFAVTELQPGQRFDMHQTRSVDYIAILEGEVTMYVDHGELVRLKAGDLLVQRGTIHSWVNESDRPARWISVIVDAKPLELPNRNNKQH